MAEKELTDKDLDVLQVFTFKTEENLSDKTFERMRHTFPKLNLDSFKTTRSRAHFLASFKPVPYDCCINSCCCFVDLEVMTRNVHTATSLTSIPKASLANDLLIFHLYVD